jgi:hypothetical protein
MKKECELRVEHGVISCVESEGMTTFCASKELGCALIACSGLHLPRVSQIVFALWTCNLGCGISL